MSWGVVRGLRAAMVDARSDDDVRVVVVTGAGDEAFCSGADLGGMRGQGPSAAQAGDTATGGGDAAGDPPGAAAARGGAGRDDAEGFLELHDARGELANLFRAMWGLGKPTIARVPGWAMAGGFGLALACDLVVASERARFGAPEIKVGLWPFMVTVPMLRSMGPKAALDLMLTGRVVGADEALRLGFVSRVVPHQDLDATVDELATALAGRSPAVMRLGRDAFYAVVDMPADPALSHLQAMLTLVNQTEDAAEGIAAFTEKRAPSWRGR